MTSWQKRVMIEIQPSIVTAGAMVDCLCDKLGENEILEVIQSLDEAVSTWDFTQAIYKYARDILAEGGELPEETE